VYAFYADTKGNKSEGIMKIAPNFKKTYPKMSVWIETNMSKVKSKPSVWAAFIKYSELNQSKALLALTSGQPPEIHFDVMAGSNGRFSGTRFPDRVYLAKSICDKFENADANNIHMHILVESTLLHEIVHWGDWKDGVDQIGEEGKEFEQAAYGRDISRYW
jgi:hypothetical protein